MEKRNVVVFVAALLVVMIVVAGCTTPPPETVKAVKTGDDTYLLTFSDGSVPDTGSYTMTSVPDTGMASVDPDTLIFVKN